MMARAKITQLVEKMGGFGGGVSRGDGNTGSGEGPKVAGGACGWTLQKHAKS